MARVGIDQDHQIVSKTRVLDVGEPAAACHLLRPLEHPVHLGEVEVAEQRRDDPALRDAAATVGFQHDLQQAHHVVVIHSLRYLGQQPVMPNIVKIAAQVDVNNARLVLNDCSGHAVDRFTSCPLGTISKRAWLEVSLEDRLQYELERTLHHPIPDRRYRKNADLAAILRYLLPPSP